MKIQIDTEAKTIKLEGQVILSEFIDKIEKLFPDGAWKEYKLETNTIIQNWGNPIVINPYNPYQFTSPWRPYWVNGVFNSGAHVNLNNSGANNLVFNVEC